MLAGIAYGCGIGVRLIGHGRILHRPQFDSEMVVSSSIRVCYSRLRSYRGGGTAGMDAIYTREQVMAAANQAADMVIDELQLPACGARDIVNLVVNALGTLLEESTASLDDVIWDNYSEDPQVIRS